MQKANPKSTVAPKVHCLNFGVIRFLFRYSADAGTSSWLWRFNPLLLRLHREIFISLLCLHSSWVSALDLALPLLVGRLRVSVPFWEIWGLLLVFSMCSVGVVPHIDVFLMYLWGGRWSPRLTPLPSWRSPQCDFLKRGCLSPCVCVCVCVCFHSEDKKNEVGRKEDHCS